MGTLVGVLVGLLRNRDPPTLAFLKKKKQGTPKKSKGFSLRGTPNNFGKEGKNAKKSKGNRKKASKSNKARIGESGILHENSCNSGTFFCERATLAKRMAIAGRHPNQKDASPQLLLARNVPTAHYRSIILEHPPTAQSKKELQ